MTILAYLRWLKAIYRRVKRDMAADYQRQAWWKQGVSISPQAIIRTNEFSILEIGAGSSIGPYTILDLDVDPLAAAPTQSTLRIGRDTAINEFNNLRVGGGTITIGDHCLLAQFVSVIGSNHSLARGMNIQDQPWDTTRNQVSVGDDVWIGTHAVILPGVIIGSGSVIAAGAIVTHEIPAYVVAAGIPARVIKER